MTDPSSPVNPADQALISALRSLLRPMAQLALARGVPFQAAQELFKQAYVEAFCAAQDEGGSHRQVSRISTATGIHRRDVTRLMAADASEAPAQRSLAVELFTGWVADSRCRDASGAPLALPRQGEFPSFEALAKSITRDVHPRSLLDELLRLKLVSWDAEADTVQLQANAFVPRDDQARMLGFFADNVGDHLRAAVSNVLGEAPAHFEQAIFADELSAESLQAGRGLIGQQWRALVSQLVPELERLIAEDAASDRVKDRRLRIGLYEYNTPMTSGTEPTSPALPPAAAGRRRRAPGRSRKD